MKSDMRVCAAAACAILVSSVATAGVASMPDPVAIYPFSGDFTSLVPGAPDLQVVNPGGDSFQTEPFAGRTTGTWRYPRFTGFVLDTDGLIDDDLWSVGMTFRLEGTTSQYNKILDTQNRLLDFGWYNYPSAGFGYFPTGTGADRFFQDEVATIVVTHDGDTARGYLNGVPQVTVTNRPDSKISADRLMHFLLDDLPFAQEVVEGTVAAIFIWDEALDPADIAALLPLPQLIEPCSDADLSIPFGLLDLADVNSFAVAFLSGDPAADLSGNGLFDLSDINMFIAAFVPGCE